MSILKVLILVGPNMQFMYKILTKYSNNNDVMIIGDGTERSNILPKIIDKKLKESKKIIDRNTLIAIITHGEVIEDRHHIHIKPLTELGKRPTVRYLKDLQDLISESEPLYVRNFACKSASHLTSKNFANIEAVLNTGSVYIANNNLMDSSIAQFAANMFIKDRLSDFSSPGDSFARTLAFQTYSETYFYVTEKGGSVKKYTPKAIYLDDVLSKIEEVDTLVASANTVLNQQREEFCTVMGLEITRPIEDYIKEDFEAIRYFGIQLMQLFGHTNIDLDENKIAKLVTILDDLGFKYQEGVSLDFINVDPIIFFIDRVPHNDKHLENILKIIKELMPFYDLQKNHEQSTEILNYILPKTDSDKKLEIDEKLEIVLRNMFSPHEITGIFTIFVETIISKYRIPEKIDAIIFKGQRDYPLLGFTLDVLDAEKKMREHYTQYEQLMKLLHRHPALDIEGSSDEHTLLENAVMHNVFPVAKTLLELKAAPSRYNGDWPVLEWALKHALGDIMVFHSINLRMLKLLFDYGADIKAIEISDVEFIQQVFEGALSTYREGYLNVEFTPNDIVFYDYKGFLELLLDNGLDPNMKVNNGQTALEYVLKQPNSYREITDRITLLVDKGARINELTSDGETILHLILSGRSTLPNYGESTINVHKPSDFTMLLRTLVSMGADLFIPDAISGKTPLNIIDDIPDKTLKLKYITTVLDIEKSKNSGNLYELMKRMDDIGIGMDEIRKGCESFMRLKRDTNPCIQEEFFQYDPLEDSNLPPDQIASHRYATMVSLAVSSARHNHNKLKESIKYYKNIGKVVNEGNANWSAREKDLIEKHNAYSQKLFRENAQLLQEITNDADLDYQYQAKIYDNGKHSLIVFKEKDHFKIYSTDLDYKTLYRTGTNISPAQLKAFIDAFFIWKDGRSNYKVYSLSNKISPEIEQEVLDRMSHSQEVESDHQILYQNGGNIESISVNIIRDMFDFNSKPIDIKKLSKDFFEINHKNLILRVDKLHTILPQLTRTEQEALFNVVRKYNIDGSWYHEAVSDADTYEAMNLYSKDIIKIIKEHGVINLDQLSELSWASLSKVIKDHTMIGKELGDKIIINSKTLHNSIGAKVAIKEVGKQGLFFLPTIIKSINTHQYQDLIDTGEMIAGDITINKLVTSLAKCLSPERAALLSKLPITSPIFKAFTIYSIVELHQELNNLPPDAPQRSMVKHELIGQYATIGLICAEMVGGVELGPLWFALIGAQLIYEAEDMREMYKLDVSFTEALELSLGFKQDKLNAILEEREVVDIDLSSLQASKCGYTITQIPKIKQIIWKDINQDAVPKTIRSYLEKAIRSESIKIYHKNPEVELGAYKLINSYKFLWKKLRLSDAPTVKWQMKKIDFIAQNSTIKFGRYTNNDGEIHHIESNNWFLDEVKNNNYTWTRVPQNLQSTFNDILFNNGDQMLLLPSIKYKRVGPTANITDPVSRTETGNAALYINQEVVKNYPQKLKNIHFAFDPRRGNITLEITEQGLLNMDKTSQAYLQSVGNNAYTASSKAYIFQTTVSKILLPEAVTFVNTEHNGNGVITVNSDSMRVMSVYVITHNTSCIIQDNASMTMIKYIPDQLFLEQRNNYFIKGDMMNICIRMSNMDYRADALIQLNSDKKYFYIDLTNLQIKEELTLGAETLELLNAQGDAAAFGKLYITPNTRNFNTTLLGNIIVKDGEATIEVQGISSTDNAIIFAKTKSASDISHYTIGNTSIEKLLRYLADIKESSNLYDDVINKNVPEQYNITFKFSNNNTYIQFSTLQQNMVSFSGTIDGDNAVLKIFNNTHVLDILEYGGHIATREYTHHKLENISVDQSTCLAKVFDFYKKDNSIKPSFKELSIIISQEYIGKVMVNNYNAILNKGVVYEFSANDGTKIIHYMPEKYKSVIVNEITYTTKNNILCAIDGINHNIDGDKLLPICGINNKKVKICFPQYLKDSTVNCHDNNIVINGINLQNIEPNTQLSFNQTTTLPVLAVVSGINGCDQYGKIRAKRNIQEVEYNKQDQNSVSSGATSIISTNIINNIMKVVSELVDNTWEGIKSYVSTVSTEYFDISANTPNITQNNDTALSVYDIKKYVSIEAEYCTAGAQSGHEYIEGMTCYIGNNKYSRVMIFPIKPLDTCSASISQQDEVYSKSRCIPIKFNNQDAVYCEGKKSSIIYTPYVQPNILEHINDNLLLAQVFINLWKTMWQWYKLSPQQTNNSNLVNVTTEQEKIWKDSIVHIKASIEMIRKSNLLPEDNEFINYIQESKIQDLEEEILSFKKTPYVSYDLIEELDTTLAEIQNELYEIQTSDFEDAESNTYFLSKNNDKIALSTNIQVPHEQNSFAPIMGTYDTFLSGITYFVE